MDWGKLGKGLASTGLEVLGSMVAGPAGGSLGKKVAGMLGLSEEADEHQVQQALATASPETLAQIRQIDADLKTKLAQIESDNYRADIAAGSQDIGNVNKTMQEESKGDDPWTRRWRPFWGFVAAAVWGLVCLGVMAGYLKAVWANPSEALALMPGFIGAMVGLMLPALTILGVASHHRGKMQRIQAGEMGRA